MLATIAECNMHICKETLREQHKHSSTKYKTYFTNVFFKDSEILGAALSIKLNSGSGEVCIAAGSNIGLPIITHHLRFHHASVCRSSFLHETLSLFESSRFEIQVIESLESPFSCSFARWVTTLHGHCHCERLHIGRYCIVFFLFLFFDSLAATYCC